MTWTDDVIAGLEKRGQMKAETLEPTLENAIQYQDYCDTYWTLGNDADAYRMSVIVHSLEQRGGFRLI